MKIINIFEWFKSCKITCEIDITNFVKVKKSFQSLLEHVFIFYTCLQIVFHINIFQATNIYLFLNCFILLFGFFLL
jgi:hypothetical protein